jgi:transcriptional regulator with XRE-family HTH domain
MPKYREFADVVRRRRKELDKTLADVAAFVPCSIPYVSELERGVKPPPPDEKVARLAEILELDPTYLQTLAELSRWSIELDLQDATADERKIAVLLHRRLQAGLSPGETRRLLEALDAPGASKEGA